MSNASDKTLEFQCPKCARRLKASSQAAGKRLKCPGCGQPVKVPGGNNNSTSDDADWLKMDDEPQTARIKPTTQGKAQPAASQDSQDSLTTAEPRPASSQSMKVSETSQAIDSSTADPTQAAKSPSASPTTTTPAAKPSTSPRTASIFDDDLPELAELEPPRPRSDIGAILGIEGLEALGPPVNSPPAASSSSSGTKPRQAGTPQTKAPPSTNANQVDPWPVETRSGEPKPKKASKKAVILDPAKQQYRVPCPSCGTPQYVTVDKKGQTIRCPDCFLSFKIPPPPPNWKPSDKPAHTNWGTGLAERPAEEVARDAARSKANADDYLRKAEQELDDQDIDSLYDGDFDTQSFMRRTFGFCFDSACLFQVVLYSLLFAILCGLLHWCADKMAGGDKGVVLLAGLAVPLIFIMVAFPMFAAAITMLESIANGEARVREWPGFSFYDHIGELLLFGTALAASIVPGFVLGRLIGASGGMAWMVIFGTLLSTFLLFPIILLSMLDNESLFNPVSPDVIKSLSSGYESWGIYYFKTFVAYSFVFIAWSILAGGNPILTAIAGAFVPWLIFFTCQQLGVLAMDISEHLSLHIADREDDDDEIKEVSNKEKL